MVLLTSEEEAKRERMVEGESLLRTLVKLSRVFLFLLQAIVVRSMEQLLAAAASMLP